MKHRIACVGIGGFGRNYVEAALALADEGKAEVVAGVDKYPEKFPAIVQRLAERGARVFPDMDAMFAETPDVDIVTIGTGLHLHCPMALKALEHRAHVFLAKASTVLVQNVDRMIEAADKADRLLVVDFQHSYSPGARRIKQAIVEGDLGRVREVVCKVVWCRPASYYTRNDWAGRVKVGGEYALDGPLNNPHAHYITQAMLFASMEAGGFASPVSVQGELYKAHPIEGEDTACVRARTDTGAQIVFLSSLCGEDGIRRTDVEVFGDKGRALWSFEATRIQAEGKPPVEMATTRTLSEVVLRDMLRCLETGERPLVTIRQTRPHVLFTNGAYESARTIRPVPPEHVRRLPQGDDEIVELVGINGIVEQAGNERKLFSEIGVPWAAPSEAFGLEGYRKFDLELA